MVSENVHAFVLHMCANGREPHICEMDGWTEREREVNGEFQRETESLSTEIEWKMCDGRVK